MPVAFMLCVKHRKSLYDNPGEKVEKDCGLNTWLKTQTPDGILNLLNHRKSIRRFTSQKVAPETVQQIMAAADQCEHLVPDSLRLVPVDHSEIHPHTGIAYQTFISAPIHLIAIAREKTGFLENAGYVVQAAVIKAAECGLGTCWVGGFFNESKLAKLKKIQPHERVIALVPVGYAAHDAKSTMVNYVFSSISNTRTGKKRRLLEQIAFYQNYNISISTFLEKQPHVKMMLEAARISPSWRNRQPWRFIVTDSAVYLFALMEEEGKRLSGERDGLAYFRVDLGIAMRQFQLMAHAYGLTADWILTDDWKDQFDLPASGVAVARFDL
jgi:nitroreductase